MNEPDHLLALRRHNEQTALHMMEVAVGLPVQVTIEDRLTGVIIEQRSAIIAALDYLRENAPQRAIDSLLEALKLQ